MSSTPECATCAALPPPYPEFDDGPPCATYRPAKPRPVVHGRGPSTWRCATHRREDVHAQKQRASDSRSRKRSGLAESVRQAVLAEQGGACGGCGRTSGKRLNLDADHDHDLAAEHDHGEDVACEDCMRGYLCRSCNRDIIGMLRGRLGSDLAVRMALIGLHNYLGDPPAQRVIRRRRLERAS